MIAKRARRKCRLRNVNIGLLQFQCAHAPLIKKSCEMVWPIKDGACYICADIRCGVRASQRNRRYKVQVQLFATDKGVTWRAAERENQSARTEAKRNLRQQCGEGRSLGGLIFRDAPQTQIIAENPRGESNPGIAGRSE